MANSPVVVRQRFRAALRFGAWQALGLYVVMTIAGMWPALSDINGTIMGKIEPSDATQGGVWLAWQLASISPFTTHTAVISAPHGAPFWLPTFVTALGWMLPLWLFAHLAGPVAAWNILIAAGFIADAMAMYGLVRWVTGRNWIAWVAGVLYAFSPFHVEQSHVHVGYLYSWIFPLIVWAALSFLKKPDWRRALIFGSAIGAASYIDGYYIIFAPIVAVVIIICGMAGARWLGISVVGLVRNALVAGLTAVILSMPVAVVTLVGGRFLVPLIVQGRSRGGTVEASSARLPEYLIPWRGSPAWGRLVHDIGFRSGFAWGDGALYLGLVVMLLGASLGVIGIMRSESLPQDGFRLPVRFLAIAIPAATIAVMLFSFAAFGPIWGFPKILWAVEPFWRTYSRLQVAVDCLLILAAAIGLACLHMPSRKWVAPAIAILAVLDGTAVFPRESWSYAAHTATPLEWLASHQDGGVVAGYPIQPIQYWDGFYQSFQATNHHPLFNVWDLDTQTRLARGLESLKDPQTIPTLRREGIRYVALMCNLVLDSKTPCYRYRTVPWWKTPIPGLHMVLRDRSGALFRIEPGPLAPAALAVGDLQMTDYQYTVRVGHWLTMKTGHLYLVVFKKHIPLRISFDVKSYVRPRGGRMLRVTQGGVVRWQGHVGVKPEVVHFVTTDTSRLTLESSPGAVAVYPHPPNVPRIADYWNYRAIELWNLDVQAARRPR